MSHMPLVTPPDNRTQLVNVRSLSQYATASGDWSPVFAAAIAYAQANNYRGIYVPASASPYLIFKPVTVHAPSIDLSGLVDFEVVGDGLGSQLKMAGDSGGGSWYMMLASNDCQNVTIRDLWCNGNWTNITNPDPGQHVHTLAIGGGPVGGFAKHVKCERVRFSDTVGDGVALIAADAAYGAGQDVSSVDIVHCEFLDNQRSGVSNQRAAELVRILWSYFDGTLDQAVDLEPTGATPNTGPRQYIVFGNVVQRINISTAAVSNSGISGTNPSMNNVVAYNKIFGSVGGLNIANLDFSHNYVECNASDTVPVIDLRSTLNNVHFSHNTIWRPAGYHFGKLMQIQGSNGFYPDGVKIYRNRFASWVASDGDGCLVLIQNADNVDFSDNEVYNYSGGTIPAGVSINGTSLNGCKNVSAERNWIYGDADAGAAGLFTTGLAVAAGGGNIAGFTSRDNTFRGVTNKEAYSKSGSGSFSQIIDRGGNRGSGADMASGSIAAIGNAWRVGDNRYVGNGVPGFAAPIGSTYQRLDGSHGALCYQNEAGGSTWVAVS